ncbi:hypothetical protein RF55_26151 [Lasius niger]|uniref:Uncharacterized protein n=1 Tax=Lasius niger TaxID=67767 RepID=A0A0J7JUG5_LASNI|nr:hypothetical protein RF55_26151 [Lasius niger]
MDSTVGRLLETTENNPRPFLAAPCSTQHRTTGVLTAFNLVTENSSPEFVLLVCVKNGASARTRNQNPPSQQAAPRTVRRS